MWEELDLPPGAQKWDFEDIFKNWELEKEKPEREKMVAFAITCIHSRLGGR